MCPVRFTPTAEARLDTCGSAHDMLSGMQVNKLPQSLQQAAPRHSVGCDADETCMAADVRVAITGAARARCSMDDDRCGLKCKGDNCEGSDRHEGSSQ